ncbi:MAG: DNA-binding protein WhiA [Bacilli bacterium]|nr:DNA-binding protein WhiA [Bacilli bacterium]MBQ3468459.1 DNA-binding protein WhiA [Bacilli bacterium]
MSYTVKVKEEILNKEETTTEKIAKLAGFIKNNGLQKEEGLVLATENKQIKDRIKEEILSLMDINIVEKETAGNNFSKKSLYMLEIVDYEVLLKTLGLLNRDVVEEYIVDSNAEIRAYIRGAFLASGSVNDPKTSRYHMEIVVNQKEEAVFLQKLINIFMLNAKILNRDKGYMIYLKDAEAISDFLKILGANNAVMYYEDIRIYRDKMNRTNRLNNCEQANTDKIVNAALEELKCIEKLEENMALDLLDEKVQEAAIYRKKYPESSLKELSEIISLETNKKITKSGLYHRFRKIKDLANKFE